ncbi:MAG TPA: hypothetical protein VKN36_11200 [Eudoraea sp.]|nr:hypothetical protein [Eudoraea sp.]
MDILYKRLLLVFLVILAGHALRAQEKVSKSINNIYDMTGAGKLHIENKYGDITVEGWDKNSVEIAVEITVSHKKRENAENLLERITPNIRAVDGFITIETEIAEKSSGFFSRYFNKANPFDFDRSNVQIDYTIRLPSPAELQITNKFGDVIINGWEGTLETDMEHGDLWINNDIDRADLSVKYGKLRAKMITDATISVKNGSLALSRSNDLRLSCSGSDIKIGDIQSFELISSKDEIDIENVKSLYGDLRFSTLHVGQLADAVNLSLKITDFSVDHFYNPAAVIVLDQESSEIRLNISNLAFDLNVSLEEGLFRLPKSFKNINTKIVDSRKRIREISATYGNKGIGKMTINGVKGVILLEEL